ncbi:hypothetical protein niasHT_034504 [Heterodera trifolii]|uniref:PAZ domain-containing protein n=1 Tax=Heterodera trifolii TaxID=157864 RepID=A0ABD2IY83_9BILA
MVLITEFCSKLLSCRPKTLRDRLNHPEDRSLILKHLIGRKVRTTYNDRNGMTKTFFVGSISTKGAAFLPAYGQLRNPFNINVAAHFYARHRIRLHFPYLPCVIERFSGEGENRHYPMELLDLIDDNDNNDNKNNNNEQWFGRLFTEIGDTYQQSSNSSNQTLDLTIDEEMIENSGRSECSQNFPSYW